VTPFPWQLIVMLVGIGVLVLVLAVPIFWLIAVAGRRGWRKFTWLLPAATWFVVVAPTGCWLLVNALRLISNP
jgi:hypothetical protein